MNFNEAMQILGNKLQEKYGHLGFKYKKSDKTLTRHSKNFIYMIAFSSFGREHKGKQIFDNQSIEKSLVSGNPLVRIFTLLDRRLGKRRLLALEKSMEQELDWVRAFYIIRMQAEGLMEQE